ncbi:MAG: Outer rane efflux protein [Verrucomicrobiales bacterium]|nr:Outer rane efflux protein [Verrucomicrobiales bacterium]
MRCLFYIISSVLLIGCVHYESKPLDAPQSAKQLQTRSLDSPELKAFLEKNLSSGITTWPLPSWSFEQLALAAYFYHPNMEVARAQWRTAEAVVLTAGGRPNPTVSLTPGFNSDAANGVSPWMPVVSFDIPIETAHKRDFRIAVAQSLSHSAKFNISTTAWQVRSNLRTALLNFIAAERRETLLRSGQENQNRILASLKQNEAAGAIARNEVRPALIAANRLALDLLEARRQAQEARARIAEAIGVPVNELVKRQFTFDFSNKPIPPDDLHQAQEIALKGRSDILSALADYAAMESTLQLEIAKQYPDVHISPNYQWDQGESKWALGVTVELPLLNRNQGPIAEAKARREEAAAKFVALQAKVLSEIELALASYHASVEQQGAVDELLKIQREQLNSIEAQEKAGAMTQLDRLTAQTEINAAELSRFESEVKIQQSLAALEDALQRPFSSERAFVEPEVSSFPQTTPTAAKGSSKKTKSKR